jgi:hypothetical protein
MPPLIIGTGGTMTSPPISTAIPPSGGFGGLPLMMGGAGSGGTGGTTPTFDAGPVDPNLPPLARCDLSGTWASIIRVPVTWPEAPLVLHMGTGEVIQWNISQRVRDTATMYHEVTAPCGIFLPDLSGSVLANNQKFGIRFPNQMFDDGDVPPVVFSTTTTVVGTDVNWTSSTVALLTGLLMANPESAPWPSDTFPVAQTPDEDHDGATGVTVLPVDPATDSSYNWPPVGLPPITGGDYPRASRISVAVRSVATLSGNVSSCEEMRGAVNITVIGGAPALNSMVIGCTKTTGEVCNDSEASFLNSARPQFVPSGPGTLASVRLPSAAGCPDVRSRLPQ